MAEVPFDQLPKGTQQRIKAHKRTTRRTVAEHVLGAYMLYPHGRGFRVVWAPTAEGRFAAICQGWLSVQWPEPNTYFGEKLFLAFIGKQHPFEREDEETP